MFKNYLKIALRNLLKYKGYSLINIIGLAVGIASCIMILLFVQDELSYDDFHEKSDRLYRVGIIGKFGDMNFNTVVSCSPLAKTLVDDFPEIEASARIWRAGWPVFRYKDKVFSEENFLWADSTLFDVFSFEFVNGDPASALTEPNTVILTESMAQKYFGDEDPIGKSLNSDNRRDYMVVGIVKDYPANSHLEFGVIASFTTYEYSRSPFWLSNNVYTYFVLKEGSRIEQVEEKFNEILMGYTVPQIKQVTGVAWEEHLKLGNKWEYFFQPVSDIHLHSHYEDEFKPNSDVTYIYFFSIIALAILVIAIINFMNLSTARSAGRAKEVGIRKTVGSSFKQLVSQFLSESVIMSFMAVLIAVGLVYLMLPSFNQLAMKDLSFELFNNIIAIPLLLLATVVIGLIAGSYPAFFLASFKPIAVLAGKLRKGSKGGLLRSGLVVIQFSVSIFLFIGTFVIYNQLQYVQNKNLGYNKEQVVVIHKTDDIGRFIQGFKDDLKRENSLTAVTNTNRLPGMNFGGDAYRKKGDGGESVRIMSNMFSDYDFIETYQIEMKEGRFYSPERVTDTVDAIVINEAAVKYLGLENPIGSELIEIGRTEDENRTWKIIGVVKDFHFESLHKQIDPLVMKVFRRQGFGRYVSVRINPNNLQATLKNIEEIWHKYAGNQAFEYTFFDEDFAALYKSEQRTASLFASFSILAIIIACLGLLGLAAFTAEQRTKEIGIRKAMGATIISILILLSKEFAKWVVISNLIAWPVAYYLMNNWLEDFSYRIDLGFGVFIVAGIAALFIAIITVSSQALRAASTNPADSLRYE